METDMIIAVTDPKTSVTFDPDDITTPVKLDVPLLIVLIVAMVMGTFGNALIIGAVFASKTLRTTGNMFIVNLAIADILVAAFVDPFSILGAIKGEQWFIDRAVLCDVIGSVCLTACISSLLNITVISINRYIHICHPLKYNSIFTVRNTAIFCLLIWVAAFIIESPNLISGDHWFDPKQQSCLWDRTQNYHYSVSLWSGVVLLPVLLTALFYARIFFFVRASRRKVGVMDSKSDRQTRESAKLARTLFIIFLVFAICWTPYAVVIIGDRYDTWSATLHVGTIVLAHTNSSLNFILYGVTNKQFRAAYFKLLNLKRCFASHKEEKSVNTPQENTVSTIKVDTTA